MSLKKIILAATAGIVVGGIAWVTTKVASRSPASTPQPPMISANPLIPAQLGKMNQAMTVVIKPVNGVPDHNGQELTLRAEVTLHRSVSGEVQFQWDLPAGAEIVSGHVSDSWANLQAGQTAATEISLINVSKEGIQKTVSLQVSAQDAEVKYAVSGSFATNDYSVKDSGTATGILKVGDDKDLGLQNAKEPGKMLKLHQ